MYDLSGVTCNYTDNKYGWMNISNAQVIHGRDGYIIKMPKRGALFMVDLKHEVQKRGFTVAPVSYTHLTLPTTSRV